MILAVAAIILLALWSLFIWGLSAQNAYRTIGGEERAERYDSQRQSGECGHIPLVFDPCAPNHPQTEDGATTAEYDLAAQNRMADWALAVTVLSGLGLIVNSLGVYYVAGTLRQAIAEDESARDVVENERLARQAEVGAHFVITNVRADIQHAFSTSFRFEYGNCGRTVARRPAFVISAAITELDNRWPETFDQSWTIEIEDLPQDNYRGLSTEGEFTRILPATLRERAKQSGCILHLHVAASFTNVFRARITEEFRFAAEYARNSSLMSYQFQIYPAPLEWEQKA